MQFKSAAVLIVLTLFITDAASQGISPVGTWTEHFSYKNATCVIGIPGKIVSATPYAITIIDRSDNSISRLSKLNGLSETGISAISYNPLTNKLVVGYTTGNLDIISESRIINTSDLKLSSVYSQKRINEIFNHQNIAYLATDFGIVAFDTENNEIKETYLIGTNGSVLIVHSVTVFKGQIFAATDKGLLSAPLSSSNLQDFRNWILITTVPAQSANQVISDENIIMANVKGTLYTYTNNNWEVFYSSPDPMAIINLSKGKIIVMETLNGRSHIKVLSPTGVTEEIISGNQLLLKPSQVLLDEELTWIADKSLGLLLRNGNEYTSYLPDSPEFMPLGSFTSVDGSVITTAGGRDNNGNPLQLPAGMARITAGSWTSYTPANNAGLREINDLGPVAYDAVTKSVWTGSTGDGLIRFGVNDEVSVFKEGSFISPDITDPNQYKVTGLATDRNNTLWISNYGTRQPLLAKKTDGTVYKFSIPFTLSRNAISDIMIDDAGQKWIIAPEGNGLICFNHGQNIENISDDQWRYFRNGAGNGNLPVNEVLSITKDDNGFIWIGTSKGIAIIPCPELVFTNQGCEAILPVVQQGNFAGLLFADQRIQSIAVDGANRKWIATTNGVWLLSADGEKVISRFTETNSPLPSDSVEKIFIHDATGEVFFATRNGLCSFRGNATTGTEKGSEVLVFPNPVPPGYNGTIAIRGLIKNSIVKITELNGRLVYQTRALGGQAVWNGRDYKGRTISSGVYLVLVSNDERTETVASKIVFIRK